MEHIMKLQPKYFEYIKYGTKRVELRLNDEKRKNMKISDTIILKKEYLYNIDLKDEFFNTLREDYLEFDKWFEKKQI